MKSLFRKTYEELERKEDPGVVFKEEFANFDNQVMPAKFTKIMRTV